MIRVLERGPCVQYQRDDGGWRVGHVYEVVKLDDVSAVLVRERHTGELLVVGIGEVQPNLQSPIPEPGSDAVQDDEVWHAPGNYPDSTRDVMGDFGGVKAKTWCGYFHHGCRRWMSGAVFAETEPTRWRELKDGEL